MYKDRVFIQEYLCLRIYVVSVYFLIMTWFVTTVFFNPPSLCIFFQSGIFQQMHTEDNILILRLIKEGDRLAFRHLFETWFTPLCRFMHLYISEKTVVEELALDLFMHIWENRKTLQIQVSLKSYLFQAARNRCLNELRKQKNTVSLDEISGEIIDAGVYSLEETELQNLIQEAVLALPDKCREVFDLSRYESLSNREIADRMNISVKTVEAQITKALKRIKNFLGEAYFYFF